MNPIDFELNRKYGLLETKCTSQIKNSNGQLISAWNLNFDLEKNGIDKKDTTIICKNRITIPGYHKLEGIFKYNDNKWQNTADFLPISSKTLYFEFKSTETPINLDNSSYFIDLVRKEKFIFSNPDLKHKLERLGTNTLVYINLTDKYNNNCNVLGYGPNFKLSDFSAEFYNIYTPEKPIKIKGMKFEFDIDNYISVSFPNNPTELIANSFEYALFIKYRESQKQIKFIYPRLNDPHIRSNNDYSVTNSNVEYLIQEGTLLANNLEHHIAKIWIYSTDKYLYNFDFPLERISYAFTQPTKFNKTNIRYKKIVDGIYDVFLSEVEAGNFTIKFGLNKAIDNTPEYISGTLNYSVLPDKKMAVLKHTNLKNDEIISQNNIRNLDKKNSDTFNVIYFAAEDRYTNLLNFPIDNILDIGLSIKVSVNGEEIIYDIRKNDLQINYDKVLSCYSIQNNLKNV
jgi:hypothetical protein